MATEATNPRREVSTATPHATAAPPVLRGLHAQTIDTIGRRIISGHYDPGDPLPQDELLQELRISRTVLREALRVLADKGLVSSRQKLGTQVRPRSAWQLLDSDLLRWLGQHPNTAFLEQLAEVRAIMEPASARLAAERRTDEDIAELRAALQAMSDASNDADAIVEADLAFHRALLNAVHNELLTRMEVVIEAGLRARDVLVHGSGHTPEFVPVHRAVADAIEAQDADAAAATMQALLAQASRDVDAIDHPQDT